MIYYLPLEHLDKRYTALMDRQLEREFILHQPHYLTSRLKRVHRLVVLPDYQGIGIGIRLLNYVGEFYKKKDYRFRIVTSTPALLHSLKKFNWKCKFCGRKLGKQIFKGSERTASENRNTASFEL